MALSWTNREAAWAVVLLAALTLLACVPLDGAEGQGVKEALEENAVSVTAPDGEKAEVQDVPITVTYFTPAQTEGPYYPVNKPVDRDNDLFVLEGAAGRPAGEILVFGGTVFDGSGMPVRGAVIEIWQTDDNGAYLHPRDPSTSRRDVNFQSYGEAVTGENGSFGFRTIMPGTYEPRPRHIHVKVRLDGKELLTTQFYFSSDPAASEDRIFAGAGQDVGALIMEVEDGFDAEGNAALVGRRDIVLREILSK